jgi:hypothetical protein
MPRSLRGNQKQFGLVEFNIVASKARDVLRPSVGCRRRVNDIMPFGRDANGRRIGLELDKESLNRLRRSRL